MEVERLSDGQTGLSALELADEFLSDNGVADLEQQRDMQQTIMLAAETLADTVGPGQWGGFDAGEHFRRLVSFHPLEQVMAASVLMGFFSWLFACRYLDAETATRIVAGVAEAGPRGEGLTETCRSMICTIEELSEEALRGAS